MPEDKNIPISEQVSKREFKYSLKATNLSFVLRTDIPDELESFAELLKYALVDVEKVLAEVKK